MVILCDSWYAKKNIIALLEEFPHLDIICNARTDSVIYGPAPERTGKNGRPAKNGARLSIQDDFGFSEEKIVGCYTAVRRMLTNLFGNRNVLAYITSTDRESGSRRLFFGTFFPTQLQIFCAWQEDELLQRTGSKWMQYIPLLLYRSRWQIETSYYEQKSFWSLCSYMVRSSKGIEMLVNLINISYYTMKLLPYSDNLFAKYQCESVQEFRFLLSEQIREQVFFSNFVNSIETTIKSEAPINSLECWVLWRMQIWQNL